MRARPPAADRSLVARVRLVRGSGVEIRDFLELDQKGLRSDWPTPAVSMAQGSMLFVFGICQCLCTNLPTTSSTAVYYPSPLSLRGGGGIFGGRKVAGRYGGMVAPQAKPAATPPAEREEMVMAEPAAPDVDENGAYDIGRRGVVQQDNAHGGSMSSKTWGEAAVPIETPTNSDLNKASDIGRRGVVQQDNAHGGSMSAKSWREAAPIATPTKSNADFNKVRPNPPSDLPFAHSCSCPTAQRRQLNRGLFATQGPSRGYSKVNFDRIFRKRGRFSPNVDKNEPMASRTSL